MSRHIGIARNLIALAMVLCGGAQTPACGEPSRAEVIASEQKTKAAHLRPEGPSTAENIVVWVQHAPLLGGTSGPYPWLGNMYPGTGMGMGAGYIRRMARRSRIDVLAAVSPEGSSLFEAHARTPEVADGRLTVQLDARYTVAKDLAFYGLGPHSELASPVSYDNRPAELGVTTALRLTPWLELSGGYKRMSVRTAEHAPASPATAPGLGRPLSYNVVQASAAVDSRTSPGYSTRGGLQRLTWSQYLEASDRPFSFGEVELEEIQLVPLLHEQYVLAFRGVATVTTTSGNDQVPVVLAPSLGDAETLRGFDTRRFTDRNRLLFTGEYRWRPSHLVDMAVFFDAGRVAAWSRDLGLSELETDWGIGSRFHSDTIVVLRTEIAKSRDGWQLVVAGGKAF